jgi:para-nitrobenzyl esterase
MTISGSRSNAPVSNQQGSGDLMKFACKVALIAALAIHFLTAQTVQIAPGKVSGQKAPDANVTIFKGIPFAAPPLGDLRWRAPQPPPPWDGVRKADAFSASCMQLKAGQRLPWTREFMVQNQVNEDCLYLNVWTPSVDASANLPVLVFIHGGGFSEGSGAIEMYWGTNLAASGAVVVTINYRLGVFGFLAHPELTAESEHHASGNYGLLDQITALQWVKRNIAQFGGDPHRVTIWGQSAGAFSVAALIASPLAAGLFQGAQADSGIGFAGIPMENLSNAEQSGLQFAIEHHAASIKELRTLPADALLPDPNGEMAGGIHFAPIVDGWILPSSPKEMNTKGNDNDVPVVTGYQAGDAPLFFPKIHTLDDYRQMVLKRYGDMAAEFEQLYPVTKDDNIKDVMVIAGQERNRVSMFLWASTRVKSHSQPVFTYYFDRAIPWPQHPEFGAFHTGEIPYFFLNLKMLDRPWEKADFALAKEVSSYLLNFAAKSDPNGPGLPRWPGVDARHQQTMELGSRSGAMPLADKAKVEFWTRYFNSPVSKNAPPF